MKYRTRRAGLPIRLQVDPSGTGTARGFGSRSQETEVAAASIIHRTRVTHYRWETHKANSAHTPSYFLGFALRQGGQGGEGVGRNRGEQNRNTQRPLREHGKAPHISEISEVSLWYEPPEALSLSQPLIRVRFTCNPLSVSRDTASEL